MALIKCPECGKEISDKSSSCIHCGCPINKGIVDKNTQTHAMASTSDSYLATARSTSKKKLLILGAIGLTIIIGIAIWMAYYTTVMKPLKTYETAVSLLETGKYEEANQLFNTIPEYGDVETLQEQLVYEARVYECISSVKEVLKNPDSLQIYEVQFYKKENNPTCVMRFGAQNGFGGNTTSYGLFIFSDEDGKYTYRGSCDTLDKEEIDTDDISDYLVCSAINKLLQEDHKIGSVDINRIKTVLKDGSYSTVKIVE